MSQTAQTEEEEIQREEIKNEKVITHSMVNTVTSDSLDRGIDKIIDIERYSNRDKEIRKIARSPEVWKYLTDNRITWNFIVEKEPWWGGYWERLVRSIKSPIKKVIGGSTASYDEMCTLLTEVEAVINARPLTYVYDDKESVSYPLTPSDLIYGRRITALNPNSQHYEITSRYNSLTKRLKHHRHLLSQFTRRWRNEYLTSLREQVAMGSSACDVNAKFKVGDVVILKNDSVARAFWKLAKVEQLLPGGDGSVRAAILTLPRGTSSTSNQRLRRPIQQLIPTEVKQQWIKTEQFRRPCLLSMYIVRTLNTEPCQDILGFISMRVVDSL
nr:uncharacterized protein LOC131775653 [Pocillopora verrucosa]